MRVNGTLTRTIWLTDDDRTVEIIDQTRLPFEYEIVRLETAAHAAHAISSMQVRGAPLTGVTAAYGMALAMAADPSDASLQSAYDTLLATRPTASNLRWALDDMRARLGPPRCQ